MAQIRLAVGDYSDDVQNDLITYLIPAFMKYSQTLSYLNSPKPLISLTFVK